MTRLLLWLLLLPVFLCLQGQSLPFPGPGTVHSVGGGGGPVVFDAVTSATCGPDITPACTSGTTSTYSHTVGSGSHRALAVGICASGPSATVQPAVATVTYAGVSLAQKKHQGTNYYCDIWSLADGVEPTSGANNVVIVLAAAQSAASNVLGGIALSFTGVDQTTAWTSTDGGSAGSSTTAATTITASGANDMGVHFECNGTSVSATVGANETSRAITATNTAGACNVLGGATATGGDTSFSRTVGSDSWLMVGGALKGG